MTGGRHSIPRLLAEGFRVLDGHLHEGMVAAGHGDVRPAHYAVFRYIKEGGSRVTEIAEEARITKQSMGELVGYLEGCGYVERRADPSDGRAKIVALTELGDRFMDAATERVSEMEAALAERMGKERMENLAASLEELRAISEEPMPARADSPRT